MSLSDLAPELLEQIQYQPPRRYEVILHNDDFTPMDFVIDLLMRYFRHPIEQATEIMLQIHHQGSAVCGTYYKEIAETKVTQVQQRARAEGYPLLATMQPERQ
jgi:ATP-dependent Clp protease adaptor protein ClpS